ncbi:hypothetical protein RHGRI_034731 [Rhododendron griersonianum]|uniref:26S proteasome non-ATPase regulatory subunit 2 homolog n=1 Tax=Rhododendron griersonianum TaxID=479676 RepID=A0AAV6I1T4_9ERIC|nr:hypothetical protein RHGRI_034731 [Rhododendron griersonianum]
MFLPAVCLPKEDREEILDNLFSTYSSFPDAPRALQIALFLNNMEQVGSLFSFDHDLLRQKQLCYIIARQGITFVLDKNMIRNDEDRKALQEIINNTHLCEGYRTLAREVSSKSPEDIYEAHLLLAGAGLESALQKLAATFANAFGNAGCGQDNLMTVPSKASGSWVFKNYEHRKTSAAASLGMLLMWDVDSGLAQLDKYLRSDDNHVIAGALLGVGILTCRVKLDPNPALPLLGDYVRNEDSSIRIAAILGLGLAYAGSHCPQIRSKLSPILKPHNQARKAPFEVIAFSALALGLVYTGSSDENVAKELSFIISVQSESDLEKPVGRLLVLGLGLLYLGKERMLRQSRDAFGDQKAIDSADAILEVSETLKVNKTFGNYFHITLLSCAFAGSGNVHQVRHFLVWCGEHLETEGDYQAPAVIGIAMVAMGNELALEMAVRLFEHLLRYGEVNIRRAVPLALGLLCISNPKVNVMDTLSRLSHDEDGDVVMAAIMSLGLIGAGTNNATISGTLRHLSLLSNCSESALFCIRVAQGLVHLGRGLLTIAPYHSERFLLSRYLHPVLLVISGSVLLGVVVHVLNLAFGRFEATGRLHWPLLAFCFLSWQTHAAHRVRIDSVGWNNSCTALVSGYEKLDTWKLSFSPLLLCFGDAVDENLKPVSVPVRVGKAVVATQPDQPNTVTDFTDHLTPVILAAGERAELATEK